jgi:hypothetical protein
MLEIQQYPSIPVRLFPNVIPWIKEDILEQACKGCLGPNYLPQLANPRSRVTSTPNRTVNASGNTVISVNGKTHTFLGDAVFNKGTYNKSFKTMVAFSQVWHMYLACLLHSSPSCLQSYHLQNASHWHFDQLCKFAVEDITTSVLLYHYSVHQKQAAKGPFDPYLWIEKLDELVTNSCLGIKDMRQSVPIAGPSQPQGNCQTSITVQPDLPCELYQNSRCTQGHCKYGRPRVCNKCGGGHHGKDCKGRKKVAFTGGRG